MVGEALFLGIDLGTSGCKVLLCNAHGRVRGWAKAEIPIAYPRPRWAESDPESWWSAVAGCIGSAIERSAAMSRDIRAVGVCGFMHTPVLLDTTGHPLAPAMLWSDQRCAPQAALLGNYLQTRPTSSNLAFASVWTAPKLRWLCEERPELIARTHRFLLPKDFIRFRLTDALATDLSDVMGTGMYDATACGWSTDLVDWVGVPYEKYPEIRSALDIGGTVTREAAAQSGLAEGTPVIVGSGDAWCTRVGANAYLPRRLCLYLGTAGWISGYRSQADLDSLGRSSLGGTVSCTGSAFTWARELLRGWGDGAAEEAYDHLIREAAEVAPGAEGLLFAPHLMGERGYPPDPLAKGYLFGLTLGHRRAHVARAVLEGAAFALRRSVDAAGAFPDAEEIIACGGGARSKLWRSIFSHVLGRPVVTPEVVDTGPLGAALLAAVGTGALPRVYQAAEEWVRIGPREGIDPNLVDRYERIYRVYRDLDTAMAPFYARLPAVGQP